MTVRFTAPQQFRLAFTDGFGDQKPIDIIKEIANWHVVASTAQLMGGSWKWEQGKKSDQLVGHLKLPQDVATKCEQLSGQRGIFSPKPQCTTEINPFAGKLEWKVRIMITIIDEFLHWPGNVGKESNTEVGAEKTYVSNDFLQIRSKPRKLWSQP